jgi:hypothetical protein
MASNAEAPRRPPHVVIVFQRRCPAARHPDQQIVIGDIDPSPGVIDVGTHENDIGLRGTHGRLQHRCLLRPVVCSDRCRPLAGCSDSPHVLEVAAGFTPGPPVLSCLTNSRGLKGGPWGARPCQRLGSVRSEDRNIGQPIPRRGAEPTKPRIPPHERAAQFSFTMKFSPGASRCSGNSGPIA